MITIDQTEAFQNQWIYLNLEFFDGELSPCLLNFSRKSKAFGFFAPDRWVQGSDVKPEISLNPSYLSMRPPIETVSTLLHEMVHQWQAEFGKPSRSGYHNKEWSREMERVGLIPSTTGAPGGKKTGQRVSHYVYPGGVFEQAFKAMPPGYWFPWMCSEAVASSVGGKGKSKKAKTKYLCSGCNTNVWGKPNLQLACVACNDYFEEVP